MLFLFNVQLRNKYDDDILYSSAARFPGKKQCFGLEKLLLRACRQQTTPKHAWRETVGLPKVSLG